MGEATDSDPAEASASAAGARPAGDPAGAPASGDGCDDDPGEAYRLPAILAWSCHLAGLVTSGLGNLAAGVIAYAQRGNAAGTVYWDHFDRAIKLFWAGIALFLVFSLGFALLLAGEGPSVAGIAVPTIATAAYSLAVLIMGVTGLIRAINRRPLRGVSLARCLGHRLSGCGLALDTKVSSVYK